MERDAQVLERNIALLIQRAYVPALPDPGYRDRLQRDYLVEWRRRHAPQPRRGSAAWRWALVAGVLLALGLAWRLGTASSLSPGQIVAEGKVALGFGAQPWRAASAQELSEGLRLGPRSLTIQSPAEAELLLQLSGGSLRLGPNSRASLDASAGGLSAELEHGQLEWRRSGAGTESWELRLPSGSLRLEAGGLDVVVQAPLESLRALQGDELRASFHAPSWTHHWPSEGDLELLHGQALAGRTSGLDADEAVQRLALPAPTEAAAPELPSATTTAGSSLRGRVTNPAGAAITRFRVALLAPALGHVYTAPLLREFESEDGSFHWQDAPVGKHKLFVHAEGFALLQHGELELLPGERAKPLELCLETGRNLRGFVFDAETNEPIRGARILSQRDLPQNVVLVDEAPGRSWLPASTLSLGDGSFELQHLSSGNHALYVSARGYAPLATLSADLSAGIDVQDLELPMGPGAQVHGILLDAEGQPKQGAMLIISPMENGAGGQPYYQRAFSDAEGRYVARDLPCEMLLVALVDPRGATTPRVKPVVGKPGVSAQVDFLGSPTGTLLHGRLSDAAGNPMAFTKLAIFRQEELLTPESSRNFEASSTDREGRYRLENLQTGDYLLMRVDEASASVRPLGQARIVGLPEQELNLTLGELRIEVQALEASSGLPLEGVSYHLWFRDALGGQRNYGGTLLATGSEAVEFFPLTPGEYWVSAHAPGGPGGPGGLGFELSPEISLRAGSPLEQVRLQLGPGGGLRVEATDAEGSPLAQVSLLLFDARGPTNAYDCEARTDARGVFQGGGLHPGPYRLLASAPGMQPKSVNFECAAGRTTTLHLRLEAQD